MAIKTYYNKSQKAFTFPFFMYISLARVVIDQMNLENEVSS